VIQFPDTSLTSVTIATVERHTVAFLGTKDGRLKKVSYTQTYIHLHNNNYNCSATLLARY
jgi:hypothetical protein